MRDFSALCEGVSADAALERTRYHLGSQLLRIPCLEFLIRGFVTPSVPCQSMSEPPRHFQTNHTAKILVQDAEFSEFPGAITNEAPISVSCDPLVKIIGGRGVEVQPDAA